MKKSLMEWHFLAIIANSDFLLLPILLNVVQPQYGGLVSALGSDKAQVVPTDCWVTQI